MGPLWGLRASSVLASVGEGVTATALPLLTAALTRDPVAVAAVIAAAHLPWVLVTVLGGSVLPRLERRTVLGAAHTLRGGAVAALAYWAAGSTETLGRLATAAFAIGLGEALADHVEDEADELTPARTSSSGLARALRSGGMVGVALVGLPVGGLLYEILPPVPFVASVFHFCMAGLIALLPRVPLGPEARARAMAPPAPLRLCPGTTRPTAVAALQALGTSAVLGVLVLFALDDLGLGAPSFGVLLAALAAGAALGSLVAAEVGRVLGGRPTPSPRRRAAPRSRSWAPPPWSWARQRRWRRASWPAPSSTPAAATASVRAACGRSTWSCGRPSPSGRSSAGSWPRRSAWPPPWPWRVASPAWRPPCWPSAPAVRRGLPPQTLETC
jgi:hypothetical protein